MLKIYGSSQDFGYGPTSNLFTLLSLMKKKLPDKAKISVFKNKSIEIFNHLNPGICDEIIDVPDLKEADLVISSFDPEIIVKAWAHDIKSVYYCNLFWFWHIEETELLENVIGHLELKKSQNKTSEPIEFFDKIKEKNPHLAIILGYYFSSLSFARSFPHFKERIQYFNNIINPVPCKIFKPELPNAERNNNYILFQLSGSKIPILNDYHYCIYIKFITSLANELSKKYPHMDVEICLNPELSQYAKNYLNNSRVKLIDTVSQRDNIKNFMKAAMVFTSPGLETLFECFYTNAPVFLLPEQSAGQYMNFNLLKNSGYYPERILIDEIRSDVTIFKGELDILNLYSMLEDIQKSDVLMSGFHDRTCRFVEEIQDINYLRDYLVMQDNVLKKHIGDEPFSDYNEIIDAILQLQ